MDIKNEAFSCLIGALKSPRKVNGYGADYAYPEFDFKKENHIMPLSRRAWWVTLRRTYNLRYQ
jgi:hypothetical protein